MTASSLTPVPGFYRLWIVVAFGVAACVPPGEGPKAARGYARAAPVIAALDSFHSVVGRYPDSLPQLVPDFLRQESLAIPGRKLERYPLEYERSATDFILSFRYVGPGMNNCRFRASSRRWECSGYF